MKTERFPRRLGGCEEVVGGGWGVEKRL